MSNAENVEHVEMEDINVNVTEDDGVTKIEMSFTDDNGSMQLFYSGPIHSAVLSHGK